jgi:hypothetical protein
MTENQESVYDQIKKKASTIEGMTQLVNQASQWFEKPTELTEDMRERVFAILRLSMDYLRKVPRNEDNVMLEVVGWDESRKIEAVKEKGSDRTKYLVAVDGTYKTFIDVRTPDGMYFRILVAVDTFEAIAKCINEKLVPEGSDLLYILGETQATQP